MESPHVIDRRRLLAGEAAVAPANAGLSNFGRQLIAEIESQKLLLDLSHGGQRTIKEGIAAATRPPKLSSVYFMRRDDMPARRGVEALRDRG